MANLIDYILWRGDLSFKQSPMNECDLAILSQVVMLDLDKCVPGGDLHRSLTDCVERFANRSGERKREDLFHIVPLFALFPTVLYHG